jgi:hypothetical protein
MGMEVDAPYPDSLDEQARFAYWWPEVKNDLARHKSHLMVFCSWSKFTRMDAHMRHLVLVRELDDRFHETGSHGTGGLFVDSSFVVV